mgnify:CR=1 FL=1
MALKEDRSEVDMVRISALLIICKKHPEVFRDSEVLHVLLEFLRPSMAPKLSIEISYLAQFSGIVLTKIYNDELQVIS